MEAGLGCTPTDLYNRGSDTDVAGPRSLAVADQRDVFLLLRLLLYTTRGLEQLCAPVIRKGLNEAIEMLDGFLEDGDSIGSKA